MNKILIITKDFPPYSGSGNVLRILKFSKYLPQFGWQPYIICEENDQSIDKSLTNELMEDIKTYPIQSNSPLNKKNKLKKSAKNSIAKKIHYYYHRIVMHNLLIVISKNFFFPDKNRFWAKNLVPKAISLHKKNNFDVLLVSGPSFSSFYAGLKIKQKTDIPMVLDFRDGWIGNRYFTENQKFFIKYFNKKIERQCVEVSDLVISVTQPLVDMYMNRYKSSQHKIRLLTNGFDAEDFAEININVNEKFDKLNFVYSGTISGVRTPQYFFDALLKVIEEDYTLIDVINVYFYGKFNFKIDERYKKITHLLKIRGHVEHSKIINAISFADVFISFSNPELGGKSVIPGKTFEYIAFNKPIFSISDRNAATELIDELGLGYYANYNDVDEIKTEILRIFDDWKSNKLKKINDFRKLERFERKNLTKELTKELNKII